MGVAQLRPKALLRLPVISVGPMRALTRAPSFVEFDTAVGSDSAKRGFEDRENEGQRRHAQGYANGDS